jgi:hypothetical protein
MTEPTLAGHQPAETEAAAPVVAGPDAAADGRSRVGLLATISLLMLVLALRLADVFITSSTDLDTSLSTAAFVLPQVIAVSLVAGVSIGLLAIQLLAGRLGHWAVRSAVSAGAGLVIGAFATTTILYAFGTGSRIAALAAAVGLAGAIGGALASVRPSALMAAGATATLAVFAVTAVKEVNKGWLLHLFGARDTVASIYSASGQLAAATALVSGLIAGLVAYWLLRRSSRRVGFTLPWPAYLAAGAVPGTLLLITDVITRIGGRELTTLVSKLSDYDATAQQWASSARLTNAIAVFFVGGITAMIAYGRTLPSKPRA